VEIKFTIEDNKEAIKKMKRYGELSQDEPAEPENESLNRIFLKEIELDQKVESFSLVDRRGFLI
jgi:hypothetical protein